MTERHERLTEDALAALNRGETVPVEVAPGEYLTLHPPETADEKREKAVTSLLRGGERVAKGRQRRRR